MKSLIILYISHICYLTISFSRVLRYKKDNISFEEALKDLEKIVDDLNNGDMELEKAITAYEKGIQLKNICEERLKNAQERIELIQNKKQEN